MSIKPKKLEQVRLLTNRKQEEFNYLKSREYWLGSGMVWNN